MASRSKRRKPARTAPSSAPPVTSSSPGSYLTACLILVVGIFLLYAGSYHYPPVFDDKVLNPVDLPALTTFCAPPSLRCLSYTSFGLTYMAAGLDPFWFHAGNVLCHALTVLACFIFLDRLFDAVHRQTPAACPPRQSRLLAFCGAVLFAAHPAAVYGVAYMTQRSIVMATLFSLLSLTAFICALSAPRHPWRWMGLTVLLYAAALLSKEHAVMLPAVALCIAVLLGKRLPGPGRERQILVAAVVVVASILAIILFSRRDLIGSVYEPYIRELSSLRESGVITLDPDHAYTVSLVTQAWLFFKYLAMWLLPWPGWMSVDLRQPIAAGLLTWPYLLAIPAFIIYGGIALALLFRRGRSGLIGFALLFPWLLFFTEFATARIQEPFVLYRSYLWMPGLMAALPLLAGRVSARTTVIGCAVLALALGVGMRDRLKSFENNLALWDDVVRKNPDTSLIFADRAYGNRAVALLRENRDEEALRDLDTALRLNPGNTHAYANRGTIHLRLGHPEKALADFDRAIGLDPSFAEAHAERCAFFLRMENLPDAMAACNAALMLAPTLPNARINRAVLHARAGRLPEALVDLDEMLRYEADNAMALYNRGMILRQLGRADEGDENLRVSCARGFPPACQTAR